jgi:hypothetical protein
MSAASLPTTMAASMKPASTGAAPAVDRRHLRGAAIGGDDVAAAIPHRPMGEAQTGEHIPGFRRRRCGLVGSAGGVSFRLVLDELDLVFGAAWLGCQLCASRTLIRSPKSRGVPADAGGGEGAGARGATTTRCGLNRAYFGIKHLPEIAPQPVDYPVLRLRHLSALSRVPVSPRRGNG